MEKVITKGLNSGVILPKSKISDFCLTYSLFTSFFFFSLERSPQEKEKSTSYISSFISLSDTLV